jgi:hypothetical protein
VGAVGERGADEANGGVGGSGGGEGRTLTTRV